MPIQVTIFGEIVETEVGPRICVRLIDTLTGETLMHDGFLTVDLAFDSVDQLKLLKRKTSPEACIALHQKHLNKRKQGMN